ncbi:GNAT family N-acetyltransferase [Streptomyces sporangiiformans]
MSASVTRLTHYTKAERDEITGGAVDPSRVAATGLTWLDKDVHFGIKLLGRLVAHAGLVQVPLSVGAVRLQVAGLGGVIVAPGLRGQGLARLVATAAMEHAHGLGIERGLLFCWPDLIPLYERLGWQVLPDDVLVQQPDGPVRMPLRAMWTPLVDGAEWPAGQARLLSLPMWGAADRPSKGAVRATATPAQRRGGSCRPGSR